MMMNEREISNFLGGHQDDDETESNVIVEEGLDCRRDNMRFFTLINRESKLNIMISHDSNILNCRLDNHDIVIDKSVLDSSDRGALILDESNTAKSDKTAWNCHVRGPELTFTSSNSSSIKIFELKPANELICYIKLRSTKLQSKFTYFNLKSAKNLESIDGHTILVQSNGNMGRIQAEKAREIIDDRSSILPNSLIGEIPFHLTSNTTEPPRDGENNDSSNLIICDAIYSLEPINSLDYLRVQIQYQEKCLEIEIRSSNPNPGAAIKPAANCDINQSEASSSSSDSQKRKVIEPSSISNTKINSTSTGLSDKMCLKLRVRVTNFGIAIMPLLMKSYRCKYRFLW